MNPAGKTLPLRYPGKTLAPVCQWKRKTPLFSYIHVKTPGCRSPALLFPGSPSERGPGLVGLPGMRRSSVLAARSLLWAHIPWCHAGGGQSDDTVRKEGKGKDDVTWRAGAADSFRDMLVNKMCLVGRSMWRRGWTPFLDTRGEIFPQPLCKLCTYVFHWWLDGCLLICVTVSLSKCINF